MVRIFLKFAIGNGTNNFTVR
jgi:hypothetical protein